MLKNIVGPANDLQNRAHVRKSKDRKVISQNNMKSLVVQSSLKLVCHAYLLATVFSCTTNTEIQRSHTKEIEVNNLEAVSKPEDKITYGSFTEEQLYRTIVSELSAQRGDFDDAGESYLDLAIETKDLAVIQRAIQFASVNDDVNALMQLGLLWSEVEPNNTRPHLMLSFQFLENGNYPQALSHMARVLDLGGEFDFTALTTRTGSLEMNERTRLISEVKRLVNEFQYEESLRITLVQLLAQNRKMQEAQSEVKFILEEFDPHQE